MLNSLHLEGVQLMTSIARDDLVEFLDAYLTPRHMRDHAVNGLQVVGRSEVRKVALGVSASLALFTEAARWNADLILVHHGLFWRDEPRRIDALVKGRLKILFDNDITLLAYHLPLDAHPEVGNNIQILKRLGLRHTGQGLGSWDGTYLGVVGEAFEPTSLMEFSTRVDKLFQTSALVLAFGRQQVRRVGIISGGGAGELMEAVEQGCDVYLTGEAKEPTPAICREVGINYIAAGHYNTEKFGVIALGDVVRDKLGVEVRLFDIPNNL
ncbi:MAG: Nif3-like dinuclear metal center hexameric protein [Chloroflexi bacterium]|nr:Nif3-like dinuclear metal center hexameric protein [Chloroflexota bacterium]MDA8188913.1 Nif3-like dinuclear metal center hexameric protein [Dehalococcoidales bacterium]